MNKEVIGRKQKIDCKLSTSRIITRNKFFSLLTIIKMLCCLYRTKNNNKIDVEEDDDEKNNYRLTSASLRDRSIELPRFQWAEKFPCMLFATICSS